MADIQHEIDCPVHGQTMGYLSPRGLSTAEIRNLAAVPQENALYGCIRCRAERQPECAACAAHGVRTILRLEPGWFGTRRRCPVCERPAQQAKDRKNRIARTASRNRRITFFGFVGHSVRALIYAVPIAAIVLGLIVWLGVANRIWSAYSEWSTPRRGHYLDALEEQLEREKALREHK